MFDKRLVDWSLYGINFLIPIQIHSVSTACYQVFLLKNVFWFIRDQAFHYFHLKLSEGMINSFEIPEKWIIRFPILQLLFRMLLFNLSLNCETWMRNVEKGKRRLVFAYARYFSIISLKNFTIILLIIWYSNLSLVDEKV